MVGRALGERSEEWEKDGWMVKRMNDGRGCRVLERRGCEKHLGVEGGE